MPTPSTPVEVVKHLSDLTGQLRQMVRVYAEYETVMVHARHEADMIEARAFLAAEGSIQLRQNIAKVAADKAEFAALVAESNVRTAKAKIRTIETEIDVARTYGATIRAELSTLSYGTDGQ